MKVLNLRWLTFFRAISSILELENYVRIIIHKLWLIKLLVKLKNDALTLNQSKIL